MYCAQPVAFGDTVGSRSDGEHDLGNVVLSGGMLDDAAVLVLTSAPGLISKTPLIATDLKCWSWNKLIEQISQDQTIGRGSKNKCRARPQVKLPLR